MSKALHRGVFNMSIKILIAEDDEHIGNAVKTFLQEEGWHADLCADGNEALERLYENKYELVVLDIMLPGLSGKEILKELRKTTDAPVLMMTALSEDFHQLEAFNSLADDYVTKPFSIQVLIKRIEALLRRSGALRKELRIGRLVLEPESYSAKVDAKDITLTLKEFEILHLLAKNNGKVVSHENIIMKLWGYDYDGDEGIVHTHIKNLRSKLPSNIIKTVRGVGYSINTEELL